MITSIVEPGFGLASDHPLGRAAKLQKIGYVIISKLTLQGKKTIKKLAGALPHMLVIAINIQGEIDGIETAKKVLSHYNVPLVFLTTFADEETFKRVKTVPAAGYV